ncbi:MAG: hypothetical protein IIZ57_03345 [Solobacterium sp.]|nr:hypothetical protein [Solobacterium sp.]
MKKTAMTFLAALILLSGCSENAVQADEITETEETKETDSRNEYAGKTVTGQVTAVSGNTAEIVPGQMVYDSGTISGNMETDMPGSGMPGGNSQSGPAGGMPGKNGQDKPDGQPPEKPGGEHGADFPGNMPEGIFVATGDAITVETETELSAGDYVEIVFAADGSVESISPAGVHTAGRPGGGSSEVTQGTSANTIIEDGSYSSEIYVSTGDDENALRVDGAEVTLNGITVRKDAGSSSNAENGDFYGVNAALLATNGADVTIVNADISSDARNGNGVFSYGGGTTVTISDSTIRTKADNSGGIQTTGGGTTIASRLTVETEGNSSAAIRSDRGGGTVIVDGGTYTSSGLNSPAVYSTADITVRNAELTAVNSEALVIEGKNSIMLENCDVSGNMSTQGASSDINIHNVMIYQSMSGDADVGTSSFSMTGGSLVSGSGDMFFITNTSAVVYLSNVKLTNSSGNLMTITGNNASHGWGTAGANGAHVEMTAEDQVLEGDIVVDTISGLDLTLAGSSSFSGSIVITDNEEGGSSPDAGVHVTVEKDSVWTLTGDCVISTLDNSGTISYNGYTITLADGTILK